MSSDSSIAGLLDQALMSQQPHDRRKAFVDLVGSKDWRLVLAPHVLSRQGYQLSDSTVPDWMAFKQAAAHIAESEDKIQVCLEMAGTRFSDELLLALASHMGKELVDHALPHLRTATGTRSLSLQFVLQEADDNWVREAGARKAIRDHLKQSEVDRSSLMFWLAQSGKFKDFVGLIEEFPPLAIEEWNAVGMSALYNDTLFNRAMAIVPHHPGPLLYLLRLDPLPETVAPRVMAAARSEWIAAALEVMVLHSIKHPILAQLAEIGVRLGGRCLSAANVWIGSTKLSRELLRRLAETMESADKGRVSELLWIRRQAPSADRALERGRNGHTVDPMDAAALVRQLRGDKVPEIVTEILEEPREQMLPLVLRLLCAVHREAAQEVLNLCYSLNPEVARRAKEAKEWPDILWPDEDEEQIDPE